MPDEALDRLKGLRQQGRLIPFVGSGLSKPLGLPDLSALIDIIAEQLEYDPQVFKLNGTELQLTEYYVANKRSIGPLRSEMDRLFNPSDDQIKKSRAHRALVEMKLPLIYTTNYDRIIERAFDIRKEPCHTIANLDDKLAALEGSPVGRRRRSRAPAAFAGARMGYTRTLPPKGGTTNTFSSQLPSPGG